jgi:3-oxoacyl-[acyl-carrier protein] reductase
VAGVRAALAEPVARLGHAGGDLAEPDGPERLVAAARSLLGHVDLLVCNHARSGRDGSLGALDAAMLDAHWAVNARSAILLVQAFAAQHDGRAGGRVVLMTSGQDVAPMPDEIAYAASKGALASVTRTLAHALSGRGVTVNAVDPGPTDTGWAASALRESLRARFPAGRWGEPDDAARLVAWLVIDEARWVTGQVIHSEGGLRRWA